MRMKDRSLSPMTVYVLLAVNLLATNIGALLCYCTEDECLSGERSNMCIQENPTLGCYKQYYSKMEPKITMGCVKFALLCDSSRIRPGPYKQEWPHTACCFTDHCNKNILLGNQNETDIEGHSSNPNPPIEKTPRPIVPQLELTVETTDNNLHSDLRTSVTEPASVVHPVFMLLIILIVIFLIVVLAAILVIVKIWFYRRKKAKPQKHWIVQQNMLHTKAQMSHLLTDEPYESAIACLQSSKGSVATNFDVP